MTAAGFHLALFHETSARSRGEVLSVLYCLRCSPTFLFLMMSFDGRGKDDKTSFDDFCFTHGI